jgi:hypothetical protein
LQEHCDVRRFAPVSANELRRWEEVKDINNIVNDLFVYRLQDICYAEKQLVKGAAENCEEGDRQAAS